MQRRAQLRASDQDREHVAERLRTAALEGRLTNDELDQRLGLAFAARTYGDLDELLGDLPAQPAPAHRTDGAVVRRGRRHLGARPLIAVVVLWAVVLTAVRAGFAMVGHATHTLGVGTLVHAFAMLALVPVFAGFAFLCLVLVLVAATGWALSRAWPH